jgi:glycerol uptake facilitator-like aquaporin
MVDSIFSSIRSNLRDLPLLYLKIFTLPAFIENWQYFGAWSNEFIGTILMIFLTFSPGKWIGEKSIPLAWTAHALGVIAADKIGGGPHVNPMVSVTMWSLGKCSYTECLVRIAGSMAGGLVAFPLALRVSNTFGLTPFGGPEYSPKAGESFAPGAYNEFVASFLLLFVIFLLNWELNFGKLHYWIKQTLTAVAIRYLIEVFNVTGPAMNPMLATSWAVFSSGQNEFPTDETHYFVYWIASGLGGLTAAACYVIYAGGTLFGQRLPLGPIKDEVPKASAPAAATESKKKKVTKKE